MLVAARIKQRMQHQLDRDALPVDLHRDRIDQKWHVVVDEFNDGVGRVPTVLGKLRIENAHLRRAALKCIAERKMRQRQRRPFIRITRDEIIDIDLVAIFGGKYFRLRALCGGCLGGNQLFNFS